MRRGGGDDLRESPSVRAGRGFWRLSPGPGRRRRPGRRGGADVVLAPETTAIFPDEPLVTVRVKQLADVLEGRRRPGHFDGVATIVTKFLASPGPCHAYFGEKDYQQLVIVRRLVSDLSLPVVVVGVPHSARG